MSVTLAYDSNLTVVETLEANVPAASSANRRVTHSLFNTTKALNAATVPPVTKIAAFNKALVAGAATIDLTALLGTNGATVDGTGLKVVAFKAKAPAANANEITLTEGAVDGYALAGATFKIGVKPGQEVTFYGDDDAPVIAGADKTIDMAGTGVQTLDIEIVMG